MDRSQRRALLMVAANPALPRARIAQAAGIDPAELDGLCNSEAGIRFVRAMSRAPELLADVRLPDALPAPATAPAADAADDTRLPEHLEALLARAYQVAP